MAEGLYSLISWPACHQHALSGKPVPHFRSRTIPGPVNPRHVFLYAHVIVLLAVAVVAVAGDRTLHRQVGRGVAPGVDSSGNMRILRVGDEPGTDRSLPAPDT